MEGWDCGLNPPREAIWPVRAGELTRAQVRGKRWRRSSRRFYVPADAPRTPAQRIVEVAARLPGRQWWASTRGQHRDLHHHTADNSREERLEDAGLIVVRVTSLDLARPQAVVDRLDRAHRRGLARARERRLWVVGRQLRALA